MKSASIVRIGTTTPGTAPDSTPGRTHSAAAGPVDSAAAARRARFGALPERVRHEDLVEEKPIASRKPGDSYNPEQSLVCYSCLALDLGL